MAHDRHAVVALRQRLLELGDHRLDVPVGEVVGHVRPEVLGSRFIAVVDIVGERGTLPATGEGGDPHPRAPLPTGVGAPPSPSLSSTQPASTRTAAAATAPVRRNLPAMRGTSSLGGGELVDGGRL